MFDSFDPIDQLNHLRLIIGLRFCVSSIRLPGLESYTVHRPGGAFSVESMAKDTEEPAADAAVQPAFLENEILLAVNGLRKEMSNRKLHLVRHSLVLSGLLKAIRVY